LGYAKANSIVIASGWGLPPKPRKSRARKPARDSLADHPEMDDLGESPDY
jgi:hypothetical protein